MKRFISFSGGVESTAMCLLYGGTAKAITADTGWEHPEMYERWQEVEIRLRMIHPDFEIIRVKNEKHPGGLKEYAMDRSFFPSPIARYCTRMFKIEPIDAFLESHGECELMIGLNADESGKRTGNHGLKKNVRYSYPLIDNGITRAACLKLLRRVNLEPIFPPYMQRGGCVGCFFKSKKEYTAMAMLAPDQFAEVEDIENAIQDIRGEFYGIRDGIPSMKALRKTIENKGRLFETEDIYDLAATAVQTSCGVFCHR